MKSVKQIEEAIKLLPREEFMSLANKIAAHQAALWEEQEETDDAKSLDFLSEGEEEAEFEYEEELEGEEEMEYADY